MRVLVCGGRNYTNAVMVKSVLDAIRKDVTITCIIHGGAVGADSLANWYALTNDIPMDIYPVTAADWDKHGKRAGALRNIAMIEKGKADLVVAFPGDKGTALMRRIATERNVPVIDVADLLGLIY